MPDTRNPLVSIVIPTFGRPQYLPRAVDSALGCSGRDVEVIVVPNGPDQSWRPSLAHYANDPRVIVSPITTAHANAARNHGMSLAQGEFLRFLDDDDFLLPGAVEQLDALERTGADICVGGIQVKDNSDYLVKTRQPNHSARFTDSILSSGHLTLLHAYLYRRNALLDVTWDETVDLAQDKHWLYQLCKRKEFRLVVIESAVGVWFQHTSARISGNKRLQVQTEAWSNMLCDAIRHLDAEDRLSTARRAAATQHLWKMTFDAYYLHPQYWKKIINKIMKLSPDLKPGVFLYRYAPLRWIPPRALLRMTIPAMHLTRWTRILLVRLRLYHPMIRP